MSTLNESRGASLLFRQIKINVRTYLQIQSVRGKTCTSLTKITYLLEMWCNVFDEISHILSHSVFLSWISSPSYFTSMFPPTDINLAGEPKPHRSKTVKRSAGDMYRCVHAALLSVTVQQL